MVPLDHLLFKVSSCQETRRAIREGSSHPASKQRDASRRSILPDPTFGVTPRQNVGYAQCRRPEVLAWKTTAAFGLGRAGLC